MYSDTLRGAGKGHTGHSGTTHSPVSTETRSEETPVSECPHWTPGNRPSAGHESWRSASSPVPVAVGPEGTEGLQYGPCCVPAQAPFGPGDTWSVGSVSRAVDLCPVHSLSTESFRVGGRLPAHRPRYEDPGGSDPQVPPTPPADTPVTDHLDGLRRERAPAVLVAPASSSDRCSTRRGSTTASRRTKSLQ